MFSTLAAALLKLLRESIDRVRELLDTTRISALGCNFNFLFKPLCYGLAGSKSCRTACMYVAK